MKTTLFALLFVIGAFTACKEADSKTNSSMTSVDEERETKAIMQTIENETTCFFKGDYNCWKENFVQANYAFQVWSKDGYFDPKIGWLAVDDKIGRYIEDNKPGAGGSNNPKVVRKDMIVKFFGDNVAYLIWNQYNSDKQMKNYTHSTETRIMEKQDGKWKIVNVTALWDRNQPIPIASLK
ncbi:hypothetical protein [Runella sp.]|uniref:hypothetical protein n=1 Tax=Runella sp. TaxID=1960881 RepID=UPI003D0EF482